MESIDFDIFESDEYLKQAFVGRQSRPLSALAVTRWALVAATGLGTGLTGALIDFFLEKLVAFRFDTLRSLIDKGPLEVLFFHVALCVSLAAVAGALVCFVEPLAAGSGIPEVKCRLNGVDLPNIVAPKTYVAKAVGVLFSVASGLPCGKEGPMIHSGAVIGGILARVGAWAFPGEYDAVLDSRDLITAGAAAGVAAAFGAPLGGVLFAMEEGSSHWNLRIFLETFVSSAISALALNFFLVNFKVGRPIPWGTLGSLGVLTFGDTLQTDTTTFRMWELPIFVLIGVAGGLVGALFNALNVPLTRFRMRFVGARGWRRFLEVILVTAVIAAVEFAPPLMAKACWVPDVQAPSDNSTGYWMSCDPEGDDKPHSIVAGLFVAPSEDSIKVLLHDSHKFNNTWLGAFGLVYFALACWTYGLGVPSGLFVPSLLIGAIFGRIAGQSIGQHLPGGTFAGNYALIGASAALAGMARITISLAVILIEATGNTQWTLPLLLAVVAAKWVGDLFNRGIYDIHIHLKRVPFLEAFPEPEMQHMCVRDVMSTETVTLPMAARAGDLRTRLEGCTHNGFPVVEPDSNRFYGLVDRGAVMRALLSSGEEDSEVDLRPYANRSAFVVPGHMTLRRAYALFRSMGLRHMPVVSQHGCVDGMLTRKDLILLP